MNYQFKSSARKTLCMQFEILHVAFLMPSQPFYTILWKTFHPITDHFSLFVKTGTPNLHVKRYHKFNVKKYPSSKYTVYERNFTMHD